MLNINSPLQPMISPWFYLSSQALILGHVVSCLQCIIVREQLVGVILVLERIQSRQLAFTVPPQLPFIAMPVVDIYFNIIGASAAHWNEDATRFAADLGSGNS